MTYFLRYSNRESEDQSVLVLENGYGWLHEHKYIMLNVERL